MLTFKKRRMSNVEVGEFLATPLRNKTIAWHLRGDRFVEQLMNFARRHVSSEPVQTMLARSIGVLALNESNRTRLTDAGAFDHFVCALRFREPREDHRTQESSHREQQQSGQYPDINDWQRERLWAAVL
ncbi:MAG: hypothetical protein MHM6MM_005112 [Cercozoa sp. M6MM]